MVLEQEQCDYSGQKELLVYINWSKTDGGSGVRVFSRSVTCCVTITLVAQARRVANTHIRVLKLKANQTSNPK